MTPTANRLPPGVIRSVRDIAVEFNRRHPAEKPLSQNGLEVQAAERRFLQLLKAVLTPTA